MVANLLSSVEERFKAYLSAFNSANLQGITEALHEDVEVFVAPSTEPAVTGRSKILPSYEADFMKGKHVEAVSAPLVRDAAGLHGATAVVEVTLLSTVPAPSAEGDGEAPPDVKLDVLYFYNESLKQIRHEISNIVTAQKAVATT
jgi:hypothetical protein